ncbi:hypothetical protein QJS10_CPA07g00569 [Acorus calamus]|uniref:Uncharacterized protein n=1 Tax=Acorus calamus TaxID=4465 RepID=A0AAV9EI62_ACOCL|nr:hypothetical protein QJS10_CPA07g00569 [Acorus calamus]
MVFNLMVDVHLDGEAVTDRKGDSYQDIMHGNKKPFYLGRHGEDASIMDAHIMDVFFIA